MTDNEFAFIRAFVKKRSGIDLSLDKGYLVESRLGPIARQNGFASLSSLIATLSAGSNNGLESQVVEAMTTNESSFFRDKTPFEHFSGVVLPHLSQTRAAQRQIKIWCAAASTGQEPYSLGIVLEEERPGLANWTIDILATDLSTDVIERGRAGRYSQFEVQRGLPIQLLMKHFTQDGEVWQLNNSIRSKVRWKVANLLDSFAQLGRFDVIFCRNVLIYFDRETKTDVLNRLADALTPDGFLVLGAAETVIGLTDRFRPDPQARGLYRPLSAGSAQPLLQAAGA